MAGDTCIVRGSFAPTIVVVITASPHAQARIFIDVSPLTVTHYKARAMRPSMKSR
jgi:hypothetical protein